MNLIEIIITSKIEGDAQKIFSNIIYKNNVESKGGVDLNHDFETLVMPLQVQFQEHPEWIDKYWSIYKAMREIGNIYITVQDMSLEQADYLKSESNQLKKSNQIISMILTEGFEHS